MDAEAAVPWVTIASYSGLNAEVEADLLVANLQGAEIPAERLPKQPLGMFVTKLVVPAIIPIQVMVPADRETEARELLDEQPVPTIPPRVRSVVRWFLAAMVVSGVVNGPLSSYFHDTRGLAAIGLGLSVLVGIKLIISELQVAAAVQRERPTRPTVATLAAAIIAIGAIAFLALYPVSIAHPVNPPTLSDRWMITLILVGYTLLIALLLRLMHAPRRAQDEEDDAVLSDDGALEGAPTGNDSPTNIE